MSKCHKQIMVLTCLHMLGNVKYCLVERKQTARLWHGMIPSYIPKRAVLECTSKVEYIQVMLYKERNETLVQMRTTANASITIHEGITLFSFLY